MKVALKRALFFIFVGCCAAACPSPISNAVVPTGYCSTIWASNLNNPRGITTTSTGDVIVVESGNAQLSLFYQDAAGVHKVVLGTAPGLNHAVIIYNDYLYASSSTTVFRWPYKAGSRAPLGTPQTVITGIPNGGHVTRSLIFDGEGNLLVQIGSGSNVDPNADRAGIRLFSLTTIPQTFSSGKWFVNGLRNEVGLKADAKGALWGVENGMDNLYREDFGGDIHLGNPGEELNMFTPGDFYGYPYCWSQYNLSTVTTPRGTQYALPAFMGDGIHVDKWCQNTSNVVPPVYQLHPHTAPLDLLFYYGTSFPGLSGSLFVAQHGSWDSVPPVGYRVSQINFENGMPVSDEPFFSYMGPGQTGPNWHRPVGLALVNFEGKDILLVTSDASGVIIAISYSPSESNSMKIVE